MRFIHALLRAAPGVHSLHVVHTLQCFLEHFSEGTTFELVGRTASQRILELAAYAERNKSLDHDELVGMMRLALPPPSYPKALM